MTNINNKITDMFKKLNREDYLYIGVLVLFFILVIILFFMAASFFSQNINKVFYSENNNNSYGLNIEEYTLVAKKLNITIPTDNDVKEMASSTTIATTTTPLDKQSLIIKVLNGTSKKGLAGDLAKVIEGDGFFVLTTGNEKEYYATTTLIIQENKSAYIEMLLSTIRKSYPQTISTTTSKITAYDAVIIIGNN